MVLSQKRSLLAVTYAETAVSLIDNEVRSLVLPEAFPTAQLELAQTMLGLAQEREKEIELKRAAKKSASGASSSEIGQPPVAGLPSAVENTLTAGEDSEAGESSSTQPPPPRLLPEEEPRV